MSERRETALRARANLDPATVAGFGEEWAYMDQSGVAAAELEKVFHQYFRIFPWTDLPEDAVGFDLGCGSGRWARLVAPRVGTLHCIDASERALAVARRNLSDAPNCHFHRASVDAMPLPDASMDFGYSLGVLHHVPDPGAGLRACVQKLKPGAPLLVYLYYALENRPSWFRRIWRASNAVRRGVSRLPRALRISAAAVLATAIYWPLARGSAVAERLGMNVENAPLSYYRKSSFYTMRTDALDRFGTRLEHRFTADEIRHMMEAAGLRDIRFSPEAPFWCAVGIRG